MPLSKTTENAMHLSPIWFKDLDEAEIVLVDGHREAMRHMLISGSPRIAAQ